MYNSIYDNPNQESVELAYLEYLSKGLDPVAIPAVDGKPTKGPARKDWPHKAAHHEYNESDFTQPWTNIGLLLGGDEKLGDVDCDTLLAGKIAADMLRKSPTVTWGRKSKPASHYLYKLDENIRIVQIRHPVNTKEMIIELRCLTGEGNRSSETVLPPSTHPSGEAIEFVAGFGIDTTISTAKSQELKEVVEWIAAMALIAEYFPASDKHYTKRAWARVLCEGGMALERSIKFITTAYQYAPNRKDPRSPSKDKKDIREVYDEVAKKKDTHLYGFTKLLESYPPKVLDRILELLSCKRPELSGQYAQTDLGNADRFADMHGHTMRYCPEEKEWVVYTGKRWEKDKKNLMQELCKETVAAIKKEGEALQSESLLKWYTRSSMIERVSAMKKAASSTPELIANKDQFDAQDHLLNCNNGVVDLFTGELMPHDRNLFLTKMAPGDYTPGYTNPDWTNVLETVTRKHPEMLPFLQTFVGYCAQGNKGEELIVAIHGPGGTGKGTFLSPILKALGDYATTISPDSLLRQDRSGGAASGDIARLEGYRLAVASEFNPGSKLQENFLKMVSGNDKIVARKLYQGEREFAPKFQVVFQTNNRPGFNSGDSGNRRRYVEIPFDNVIVDDPLVTRDTSLKKRLTEDKEVQKAVLAWIIAGAVEYKKHGLTRPACVDAATEEMFLENDVLGEFISDCVVRDPLEKIAVDEMRRVYEQYCDECHAKVWDTRTFNKMLRERGLPYEQARKNGRVVKVWGGVKFSEEGLARAPQGETIHSRVHRMQEEKKSKSDIVAELFAIH